ncbi:MAG TPA: SDR family NAD(P)-dependent oxidoreductase [Sphingomicrobium sp.]|jgi:NAD(P)-dependent dehydrogenase (short-subunit alcohol dehydrogenase family)|nr:SDR family NAD(P)-dependent oxidoreductase [Sphingomicrobium sp.]
MRFADRVIYVTGGGHGIGRAVARRLASEGGSLVVSDRDADAAEAVAREIVATGGTAVATSCDITDASSVDGSFARMGERFGRLDVLVNTAGGDWIEPAAFEDITDELWTKKLDLNLSGIFRCIRAALPRLIAAGPGSSVVSIGSVNGTIALSGYPYSAAKAGLEMLTKTLAAKYGPKGVRFNLITPGTIRTRVWDGREDRLVSLAGMYPLGRVGEPDDIAAAVAFLASADAAWITGITLPVDGGLLAGPTKTFAAASGE